MSYQQAPAAVTYDFPDDFKRWADLNKDKDPLKIYDRKREQEQDSFKNSVWRTAVSLVPTAITVAFMVLAGKEWHAGNAAAAGAELALAGLSFESVFARDGLFYKQVCRYGAREQTHNKQAQDFDKLLFMKNNGKSSMEYIMDDADNKGSIGIFPRFYVNRDPEKTNIISQNKKKYKLNVEGLGLNERGHQIMKTFQIEGKLRTMKTGYYPETREWAKQFEVKPPEN